MQFSETALRVWMPYEQALELALVKRILIHRGVPTHLVESLTPGVAA